MKLAAAAALLLVGAVSGQEIQGQQGTVTAFEDMTDEQVEEMESSGRIASEVSQETSLTNDGELAASSGARSALGGWDYCKQQTCQEDEGDCDKSSECARGLVCGMNNCRPSLGFHALTDCCEKLKPFHWDYCKYRTCEDREGDCDCHEECGAGLKCGVNNCRRLNPSIPHEELHRGTDCCTRCSTVKVRRQGARSWQKIEAEYWDGNGRMEGGPRTLSHAPAVLLPAAAWNLPAMVVGDSIRIKCCRLRREQCEFFVTVYHCRPCSEDQNGGIPGHLLDSNWDAGTCAPRFTPAGDASNTAYGMTTFHKTFNPGDVQVIPLGKDAPHVAVFERTGAIAGPWCRKPVGPNPPSPPSCACVPNNAGTPS